MWIKLAIIGSMERKVSTISGRFFRRNEAIAQAPNEWTRYKPTVDDYKAAEKVAKNWKVSWKHSDYLKLQPVPVGAVVEEVACVSPPKPPSQAKLKQYQVIL